MQILLITSMFTLIINTLPIKATNTIYIRPDGSIDPSTAPIQRDGNLYTFTADIYEPIVVQRSNIVIDGNRHTLRGSDGAKGFYLFNLGKVVIKNTTIAGFESGIYVLESYDINITANTIASNTNGIYFDSSTPDNYVFDNDILENVLAGVLLKRSKGVYIFLNDIIGREPPNPSTSGIWIDSADNIKYGNISVFDNNIASSSYGVYLEKPHNLEDTVSRNNIYENNYGIYLIGSSNNTVSGNTLRDNDKGIYIKSSSPGPNKVYDNTIVNTIEKTGGILIESSSNSELKNNRIAGAGNRWNFGVWGNSRLDYLHNIDDSNKVDDKPIYYLRNKENYEINPSKYPSVGYLALVDSKNITVRGLTLEKNGQGILLVSTRDSTITKNTITRNGDGVLIFLSSYNNVYNNTINSGSVITPVAFGSGVFIRSSPYNNVLGNSIADNDKGIYLTGPSIINTISGNNITNSRTKGVYISLSSDGNEVSWNNIINSQNGAYLESSKDNVVSNNKIIDSKANGVYISASTGSTVSWNNITRSVESGVYLRSSHDNNEVSWNNIINSQNGVYIDTSNNNLVSRNNITNSNANGVYISSSNTNTVSDNNITRSNEDGVYLNSSNNNNVFRNIINNTGAYAIRLSSSPSNDVYGNTIENSGSAGISLSWSNNIEILGNNITQSYRGIDFYKSEWNTLYGNTVEGITDHAIHIDSSPNNNIFNNNFIIDGAWQIFSNSPTNYWNSSYRIGGTLIGGNYWSAYTGIDVKSGPNQDLPGSDGIWDTPYSIPPAGTPDYYPLVNRYEGSQLPFYELTIIATVGDSNNPATNPAPGVYRFIEGQVVTVYAIQYSGYTFLYWELDSTSNASNPIIVNMNASHSLKAVFERQVGLGSDIAVTDVTPYQTVVGQNFTTYINVPLENQGNYTETFDVTLYADLDVTTIRDEYMIGNLTVILANRSSTIVKFQWNQTLLTVLINGTIIVAPKGNYTISAYAWPVPDETDTADNTYTDGTIVVAMPCDIAGSTTKPPAPPDGRVFIQDLFWLLQTYGSDTEKPNWNPNLDFAGDTATPPAPPDGKVNFVDVFWFIKYYGKTDP